MQYLLNHSCDKNNATCSINACINNIDGSYYVEGQTISFFKDDLSGMYNYYGDFKMYDKNGNLTSDGGCLYVNGDNPCVWLWRLTPIDNAGNQGEVFTMKINTGYIGIDTILGC